MQALTLAATLKPEIRLVQAVSEFERALPEEHRSVFKSLKRPPSTTDVILITAEIDREAGRKHRSWRSKGPRLTNLLNAIQKFTTVGDALVGGSQNLLASGIWAAARFSFQVSRSLFDLC